MAESETITEPEEWRPVVDWEGLYEVSSLGRIRRSFATSPKFAGKHYPAGFVMKTFHDPGHANSARHYPRVEFSVAGRRKNCLVHLVVARAFLGEPDEGQVANHLDSVRWNNRASNLEWTTQLGNMAHALTAGRVARGERQGLAKLTDDGVRLVRSLLALGHSRRDVARRMNVCHKTVMNIDHGKIWRHVR